MPPPPVDTNHLIAAPTGNLLDMRIDVPFDPSATIIVSGIPDIGTVELPGQGALIIGDSLTAAELQSLVYRTADGTSLTGSSTFSYDVTLLGETSSGTVSVETVSVEGVKALFVATNASFGKELWSISSDGTVSLFDDINLGTGGSNPGRYNAFSNDGFVEAGGYVYLSAKTDDGGDELYRISADGTGEFLDLDMGSSGTFAGIYGMAELEGDLVLALSSPVPEFGKLYRIGEDGLPVVEITSGYSPLFPGSPGGFGVLNDKLYFSGLTDDDSGFQLYEYDGNGSATQISFNDGFGPGQEFGYVNFQGSLVFRGNVAPDDTELFRLDPSGNITQISDIFPGTGSATPGSDDGKLIEFNGSLIFSALASGQGRELYQLDSNFNVTAFPEINPGGVGSTPSRDGGFQEYNDKLYFSATDGNVSFELFQLDKNGVVSLAADIRAGGPASGSSAGDLGGFEVFNNEMYFTAISDDNGRELHKLDLNGDVTRVTDIATGSANGIVSNFQFAQLNDELYFAANDGMTGTELWKIDTAGNVSLALDINSGANGSSPLTQFNAGGVYYLDAPILPEGTSGDDTLFGSDRDESLFGGLGSDILNGQGGDDFLFGGSGADQLDGGSNSDTIDGGAGDDFIYGGTEADTLGGGDGNDFVQGEEGDDYIYGNAGVDTLNGGDGNDVMYGGADTDALGGDAGDDVLFGEGGVDYLYGLAGSDTIDGGTENDFIYGGKQADTLGGGDGDDQVQGDEGADYIYGNEGGDLLNGNDGNDFIFGLGSGINSIGGDAGDDFMQGGFNTDYMWGGSGADKFHVHGYAWHDFYQDFEDGTDKIDLSGEGWGYTSTTGPGATGAGGVQLSIVDDANGDAFVSLGYNTWISVIGVSAAQLTNDDFIF